MGKNKKNKNTSAEVHNQTPEINNTDGAAEDSTLNELEYANNNSDNNNKAGVTVLGVYLHCQGCVETVVKSLRGFDGVEEVEPNTKDNRVTVKGKGADPVRVAARVRRKSGKHGEIISHVQKKQQEKKVEKKPEAPKVIETVLKMNLHCEGCAKDVKHCILKMEGVQLAAAHALEPEKPSTATSTTAAASGGGVMGSLRWIELQLVAFVMVFSATGLVPLFDLVFPALITGYLLLLSHLAFPGAAKRKEIVHATGMLRVYSIMGTVIGLFLPLAYVLGGFARGDNEAVRSATPQLFLLSFQLLTENVISWLSLFSAPVRALVPMLYTVRRLFVILDWIQNAWFNKSLDPNAHIQDMIWYWFGVSLAVANLAYFSINIFAFLIPCFLPRAFELHFKERYETEAKLADDKHQNETKDKKSD